MRTTPSKKSWNGAKFQKQLRKMLQKGTANTVIAKRRCLYCILISVMFLIAANIGVTALLLYYINLSKVSDILRAIDKLNQLGCLDFFKLQHFDELTDFQYGILY